MKKRIFILYLTSAIIFGVSALALVVSKEDIVFPVAELGGCQDEKECRGFCDDPQNMEACLSFAQKHNLMSRDEIEKAKKFLAAGSRGPGGCNSKNSCEAFCNDINNMQECLAFAERHGLMSPEELQEASKVKSALERGAKLPGGCTNKDQCELYCGQPENMEECISFAEVAGFMSPHELEQARKVLIAVRKGLKPPSCRGERECDIYCSEPAHFEECISFAEAAGFIAPEEAVMARKTGGRGPGDCRGREQCEAFCQDEGNFQICLEFAQRHGLISDQEAELVRKTGGRGPGDCRGREECERFCHDPANQETCFNFAREHGLLSEEDLQRAQEGRRGILQALEQAPPKVDECIISNLGQEKVEGLKSGTSLPGPEIGRTIQSCFERFIDQSEFTPGHRPGDQDFPQDFSPEMRRQLPPEGFEDMMGGEFMGPGGCLTPQECFQYCQSHPQECREFMPSGSGQMQPQFEQIQKQIEYQIRQETEQRIRQQVEEGLLEPQIHQPETKEAEPQSFLERLGRSAASLLKALLGI